MAEYGLPGRTTCEVCGLVGLHRLCRPPLPRLEMEMAHGLTASEGPRQRAMSREPDMSPHPRYRLLEWIGKGGRGEVFRSHDRLTGQLAALKRVSMPLRALPEVPTPPALPSEAMTNAIHSLVGGRRPVCFFRRVVRDSVSQTAKDASSRVCWTSIGWTI